ncbi:rho family-interacting cell polarization regulator 1 isoform X2 [Hemicordylus capensis]|nr:rho family-interacting cell polarization regulator 1 isoform X2 [Hemicordylus capensis]XP_053126689.1 rho family-interacting cell polarization regulator 1 isoform X2 [Hemicordylus capensis]XP_053126690.1 rho family-interacting cell polarization regulator 1 isoform X2 [Hemicordylus capensis]XP_053126691.1 rho family-interacting cell polarization regulator 1 isoform X2 [Hemicordylus capensis]XP_053126693.1 rho family-interacting cell polarization regulator 1 isoform X2 [Hemicordylus capensis]
MSLSVRPQRRSLVVKINRSQSFAGVNSTQDKSYRSYPAFTPTVSRKSGSRVSRMFSMSHKSPPPKVPQPERLDEVYEALKKGLTAYLEVHQLELEKLNTQIRESKRNSRLGFLYDLDKQVKSIERFLRRLEFHASKIDELYEAYCIQRRLRDGAHNMVKAYTTASPGSKEARESLAEASRGYKEYTENMCLLESELESQLGEFHIKMKGLAGFARLCAGDQYEIFMRYGRQRWKLRGRIEVNGKQVWDSEEMVFLPLITEFLSIKVTELKSLASHVVVGNVSCETKDLFAALPQVVAVDINDLGTIKLSLEINWNPFDKEDQPPSASTVNKTSTVNKRFSTYNQSPPDTPSMREQAFYNMLRQQEDQENGAAWSISSESSDDSSSPQLSGSARHTPPRPIVQPAVQAVAPAIEIAFTQPEDKEPPTQREEVAAVVNGHMPYARTLSQISEASVDLPAAEDKEGTVPADSSPRELPTLEMDSLPPRGDSVLDIRISEGEEQEAEPVGATPVAEESEDTACEAPEAQPPTPSLSPPASRELQPMGVSKAPRPKPVDCGLEEAISSLGSALDDYRGQFPELQTLEQELKHLEAILLQKQGLCLSRASSTSLTVQRALESFNFLNVSDTDDSEGDEDRKASSAQTAPLDRVSGASEAVAEDTAGCLSTDCLSTDGGPEPMSTGSEFLDKALVLHLNHCNHLLLKLGHFGPLRCREMYALDRLAREAQVLEMVCRLAKDQAGMASSAEEVIQFSAWKEGVLPFWDSCVAIPNVYTCPVERFLQTLNSQYAARVNERQQGLADPLCVKLVEELLQRRLPRRQGSCQAEQVTIFQYWSHFEALPALTLDSFVLELAEEVLLAQNLNSDDQDVVLKALKRVPESRLRKDGLKTLSLLLVEGNSKVVGAVSAQLRSLSENPGFRERALVCYLEQLEDEEIQMRIAACAALGCLKAKEGIEQLVYLCQTDKEAVREAAKQSLMLCGEDGKSAHRRLQESFDSLPRIFAPGSMASTAF